MGPCLSLINDFNSLLSCFTDDALGFYFRVGKLFPAFIGCSQTVRDAFRMGNGRRTCRLWMDLLLVRSRCVDMRWKRKLNGLVHLDFD